MVSERGRTRRWLSRRLRDLAEVLDPTPAGWDLSGAPEVWADRLRAAGRAGAPTGRVGFRAARPRIPAPPGQESAAPPPRSVHRLVHRHDADLPDAGRTETASVRHPDVPVHRTRPAPTSRPGTGGPGPLVRAVTHRTPLLRPRRTPAPTSPTSTPPVPPRSPGLPSPQQTGPLPPQSAPDRRSSPPQRQTSPARAAHPAAPSGTASRSTAAIPGPGPTGQAPVAAHLSARGELAPPAAAVPAAGLWPELPQRPPPAPAGAEPLATTLRQLARVVAEQEAT